MRERTHARDLWDAGVRVLAAWKSEPHQVLFPHETSEPNRRV